MIIVYTLKVSLCLIVFYLLFKLFLSKETFHRFNRVMLLSVIFLSLVIPLIKISLSSPSPVNDGMVMIEDLILQGSVIPDAESTSRITFMGCVALLLIAGWIVFFLRMIFSVCHLLFKIKKGKDKVVHIQGARVIVMRELTSPFSWFNNIIIGKDDYQEHPEEILTHELAHVQLYHSYDIVLANLLIIFQWFNPASWLLKRE